MRLYGSSPLHNYIELIFRCKRLFIVSLILGTVLTSAIVALRSNKYEASIIVALTGNPELSQDLTNPKQEVQLQDNVKRKANRLTLWVQETPDFLQEVIRNANIDRDHPKVPLETLVKEVRAAIAPPTLLNDQYMKVSIIWDNREEANAIMQALYSRFADRTVATETMAITDKRQVLEEEYKRFDADANKKAELRMQYLRDHYWQMPTLLTSEMTSLDDTQRQIASLNVDISETQVRLQDINRQLAQTPKNIVESTSVTSHQTDPALALVAQKQDLEIQLKQLENIYSPLHPKVQAMLKNIAAINQQIKEARQKPPHATEVSNTTQNTINPVWNDLQQQKSSLNIQLMAERQRLSDLNNQIVVHEDRVKQMPVEEVAYDKIERDYMLANNIRNNTQAELKAAQIDEERDRITSSQSVDLVVPPDATAVDSKSKKLLLYFLGPIIGLLVGFCFSLALEAMDHSLRTPVEVENYLGKPVLAVIPKIQESKESVKRLGGASNQQLPS